MFTHMEAVMTGVSINQQQPLSRTFTFCTDSDVAGQTLSD